MLTHPSVDEGHGLKWHNSLKGISTTPAGVQYVLYDKNPWSSYRVLARQVLLCKDGRTAFLITNVPSHSNEGQKLQGLFTTCYPAALIAHYHDRRESENLLIFTHQQCPPNFITVSVKYTIVTAMLFTFTSPSSPPLKTIWEVESAKHTAFTSSSCESTWIPDG